MLVISVLRMSVSKQQWTIVWTKAYTRNRGFMPRQGFCNKGRCHYLWRSQVATDVVALGATGNITYRVRIVKLS